jgi:hypothetical protein
VPWNFSNVLPNLKLSLKVAKTVLFVLFQHLGCFFINKLPRSRDCWSRSSDDVVAKCVWGQPDQFLKDSCYLWSMFNIYFSHFNAQIERSSHFAVEFRVK